MNESAMYKTESEAECCKAQHAVDVFTISDSLHCVIDSVCKCAFQFESLQMYHTVDLGVWFVCRLLWLQTFCICLLCMMWSFGVSMSGWASNKLLQC